MIKNLQKIFFLITKQCQLTQIILIIKFKINNKVKKNQTMLMILFQMPLKIKLFCPLLLQVSMNCLIKHKKLLKMKNRIKTTLKFLIKWLIKIKISKKIKAKTNNYYLKLTNLLIL